MKTGLLPKICLGVGVLAIVGTVAFFLLTFGLGLADDRAGHEAYVEAIRVVQEAGTKETVVMPRKGLDALAGYIEWHKTWITAGCNAVIVLGILLIVSGADGMKRQDITNRGSQRVPTSRPPAAPL
jgi:hypothetical protein